MVDWLKLATVDYTDEDSKADLIGGPLRLQWGGWQPKNGGSGVVVETINLLGRGAVADLTGAENAIHDMLEKARRWFVNPSLQNSIWLEWNTASEPGYGITAAQGPYPAKRALILDGRLELAQPGDLRGGFLDGAVFAKLVIERGPWEHLWTLGLSTSSLSALGGELDVSSYGYPTYAGSLPGRLHITQVDGWAANYDQIWIGIRDLNEGITDFDPLWELEDGSAGTDTSSQVDATASGGDVMQCTFSTTATMAERVSITIADMMPSGDETEFIGSYLVLARLKVGSSTTAGVRLHHGLAQVAGAVRGETVYADNTAYMLVELGTIQIPPAGYRKTDGGAPGEGWTNPNAGNLVDFTISIYAERIAGSGNLDLDCLVLIPADHLATLREINASGSTSGAYIYTRESGEVDTLIYGSTAPEGNAEVALTDWQMPRAPGVLVVAAQAAAAHVLTDDLDLKMRWYPRYLMYRNISV